MIIEASFIKALTELLKASKKSQKKLIGALKVNKKLIVKAILLSENEFLSCFLVNNSNISVFQLFQVQVSTKQSTAPFKTLRAGNSVARENQRSLKTMLTSCQTFVFVSNSFHSPSNAGSCRNQRINLTLLQLRR